MKRSLLPMICLAWFGGAGIAPAMAAHQGEPVPVLARDMKELGAWVQWTRRDGYCTVQIILGMAAAQPVGRPIAGSGDVVPPAVQARLPATQVWLLRADGTAIPVLRTATEPPKNSREKTVTYTWAFPESASREAAAIAVMLDGRYYVERLEPFPDGK